MRVILASIKLTYPIRRFDGQLMQHKLKKICLPFLDFSVNLVLI